MFLRVFLIKVDRASDPGLSKLYLGRIDSSSPGTKHRKSVLDWRRAQVLGMKGESFETSLSFTSFPSADVCPRVLAIVCVYMLRQPTGIDGHRRLGPLRPSGDTNILEFASEIRDP